MVSNFSFDLHFPDSLCFGTCFCVLLVIWTFLENCPFIYYKVWSLSHILIGSLIITSIICKISLLFCGGIIFLLSWYYLLNHKKFKILMKFNLSTFLLLLLVLLVSSKNALLNSRSWRFAPMFSFKSFIVLALILK